MPEVYGYILVRNGDSADRIQLFEEMNISPENIFFDEYAKQRKRRNEYESLLERLKEGDVVYMQTLSDFGNDYERAARDWNYIVKERKADISIIDSPLIDTRSYRDEIGTCVCDIVIAMFEFMAKDKEQRKKLQVKGIQEAIRKGTRIGRPGQKLPDNFNEVSRKYLDGEIGQSQAAEMLGMARSTFRYQIEKIKKEERYRK